MQILHTHTYTHTHICINVCMVCLLVFYGISALMGYLNPVCIYICMFVCMYICMYNL